MTIKNLPPIIFGTSGLGNIYHATTFETKLAIVKECVENAPGGISVFDSAGKYGAGLALESLGLCLKELRVPKDKVIISNKLGWYRVPLTTPEPTFERGIWVDLQYDAVQKISYDGIIECYEQGNQLLGDYDSQMASVHDPDEYLAAATDKADEDKRYADILDAYRALHDLKRQGKISSIGVGAKDWHSIQRISKDVALDWVMIANSLTLHSHPQELIDFVADLYAQGVVIINSAVFNGGFLIGSDHYNYKLVTPETHPDLFEWRKKFFALCESFSIKPAEACVQFAFQLPGIKSIALSTSDAQRVKENIRMTDIKIPAQFWNAMKEQGLLNAGVIHF